MSTVVYVRNIESTTAKLILATLERLLSGGRLSLNILDYNKASTWKQMSHQGRMEFFRVRTTEGQKLNRTRQSGFLADAKSFFHHTIPSMLGTFLAPASRIGGVRSRLLATSASAMSIYNLSAAKGDGSTLEFSDMKGKVVYATNVASM